MYACGRHGVWREARHVCCFDRRWPVGRRARSTRSALACTLAVATVWREVARMLPRSAAARRSPCLLYAGCAGLYACGRHSVAQGGTCASLTGGGLSVAIGTPSGARSTRAAQASTLAIATLWRERLFARGRLESPRLTKWKPRRWSAARLTFPDVRRKVLHLIDNTVALSKSVHGYANEPDDRRWLNSRTRRSCSRARARSPMAWLPTGSAVTFSSLRLDRWTSVMHDGQPPHSNASP